MTPEREIDTGEHSRLFHAGNVCTGLIGSPETWIKRRVETVEMLSQEETRRRVSIDFALSDEQRKALTVADGVVAPISVLTKQKRRNFDLRDESGAAVPVLGKEQNGDLAQIAAMNAVFEALPQNLTDGVFEMLWTDIRLIVCQPPDQAVPALAVLAGAAEQGDRWRAAIWADDLCRDLLTTLATNYVLFAVLDPEDHRNRRVLKYAYGDDFEFTRIDGSGSSPWTFVELRRRIEEPDLKRFVVQCPGAARAGSFHVEIVIPEELRVEFATLYDFDLDSPVGAPDLMVNRAALYAPRLIGKDEEVDAYVELVPERRGRLSQGLAASFAVTCLLWLGIVSGFDSGDPDATTSILLAAAALFSGIFAVRGDHRLVVAMFQGIRRWLVAVAFAALAASATLAMDAPSDPMWVWVVAALVCTLATGRLLWSAFRAPS